LLGLLDRLVDSGKSVIVIEHHLSVMAHADWIIDLGPGAGHDGGRIVFEGTPADLVSARSTLTGKHLAAFVGVQPSLAGSRGLLLASRAHRRLSRRRCEAAKADEGGSDLAERNVSHQRLLGDVVRWNCASRNFTNPTNV
jgi:hypothetical protein